MSDYVIASRNLKEAIEFVRIFNQNDIQFEAFRQNKRYITFSCTGTPEAINNVRERIGYLRLPTYEQVRYRRVHGE